jgi:hypothetical protein
MYTPDRVFCKRLKELDPKLGCFFNNDLKKVVITYERGTGEKVPIYVVQTEDEQFRIPDRRDILKLRESDKTKHDTMARLKANADYMAFYRYEQQEARRIELLDRTKDDKYQLAKTMGVAAGASPKSNRPFRLMEHKAKGKVFK